MKRLLNALIAVILVLALMPSAFAELDLSSIRENDVLFTLDVDVENDAAFIESTMTAADRAFTHDSESANLYSSTMWDILLVDYLQTDVYPVMRLWVTYCSDEDYLNISSVSFIVGDKEYTFSGIGNKDWYQHDERGYLEQVLIKIGTSNIPFIIALSDAVDAAPGEGIGDKAAAATCKMILHGRRDVEVELGTGFFVDFETILLGMSAINGLEYLDKAIASDMTERDIQ